MIVCIVIAKCNISSVVQYVLTTCSLHVFLFFLHQVKKVILLVDAVTNGLWAFMWFVCFCFTANQLASNSGSLKTIVENVPSVINCARSGIAFSFFCILIWVSCVCVCVCVYVCVCVRIWGDNLGTRPLHTEKEGLVNLHPSTLMGYGFLTGFLCNNWRCWLGENMLRHLQQWI